MAGKRRVFGAAFKAKVALAAAKGDRTTAQLASQFGIHTSQVTAWKKQLMAQVAELFADGRQQLVLRAPRGVGREPRLDAADRPPIHQAAVLRNAEGPRAPPHPPEEGSAAHATARPRGRLSEAIDKPPSDATP